MQRSTFPNSLPLSNARRFPWLNDARSTSVSSGQPHLTDLVRLLGWRGLPLPEVRERLKPLIDQYGQATIEAATEEIVQIDRARDPPMARLAQSIHHLIRPLPGPPPEDARCTEQHPAQSDPDGSRAAPIATPAAPAEPSPAASQIVKLPRNQVLAKFRQWLDEQRQSYVVAEKKTQRALFAEARIATLDFVVYREPQNLLVTVRPHLRPTQRHDMRRWQEVFGPDYQAVRIWPVADGNGWTWTHHVLTPEKEDDHAR